MQNQTTRPRSCRWHVLKAALSLSIATICLWLLHRQLGSGALSNVGSALTQLSFAKWALAALAATVSFWAIGQYDVLIHRHLDTGYDASRARIAGCASIALGQLLGLGIFVGALARWRMLPSLGPARATRLTLLVTGWFFFGLIGVFALVTLFGSIALVPGQAAVFIAFFIFLIMLRSFLNPSLSFFGKQVELLSLRALLSFLCLALIDTSCAAAALWILMPAGADIAFSLLFPAYLAALTGALVTGTPGGVGPFELILLAFLPIWPEAEVMTGIVAFRLVYYALPGLIAMIVLFRPLGVALKRPALPAPISARDLLQAPRADLCVCRQNGARVLTGGGAIMAAATTPQAKIALFDPLSGWADAAVPALLLEARNANRTALIYKASARHAARCRRTGLKALHICDDLVLNPCAFSTEGPRFRQLRRKLRQAQKAGVLVHRAASLPIPHMRAIDAEWQAVSGPAHGFSMGVFCPDYLRQQQVFLAYHDDVLVGFVSFNISARELSLDLMRAGADAPDGTMYLLIHAAIKQAAQDGRRRLTLAALPPQNGPNALIHLFSRNFTRNGLRRFKTCFGPRREPLYALAPSWPGMALALADVARAVRQPDANSVHIDDEDYEFAPIRQT